MLRAVTINTIFLIFILFSGRSVCSSRYIRNFVTRNTAPLAPTKTPKPYNLGLSPYRSPPLTPPSSAPGLFRLLRHSVFLFFGRHSLNSMRLDCWEIVSRPGRFKGSPATVAARKLRSEALRKLIGAGYTPRLVFLVGLMMRGLVLCTAVPYVFNPPVGFGAGAAMAAEWAGREWIPVCFWGWYLGGPYWRAMGIAGPPEDGQFVGFPIVVEGLLGVGKVARRRS